MEALANLKAMRAAGVIGVTKPPAKGGRPKIHGSPADKQQAYRDRKKARAPKA